ncbi:unnamed protein product, partial [Brenthis ino]
MVAKIFLLTVLLVGVSCRYVSVPHGPAVLLIDSANLLEDDLEDLYSDHEFESVRPVFVNSRVRRQIGVANTNPDGTVNLSAKVPIAGNDKNILSAIGSATALRPDGKSYGSVSGGLALDNVNGHGLSLTGKHIPDFGDQMTAAAKANLFHNDRHDLTANAFATKTMPNNPMIPDFKTYGAGVDYNFNNKLGASVGAAHTDLFKRTDYSAMGNLNLFKTPSSSLDFNAGYSKSISPYIPKSNWQPTFGMSFSKYF